MTNSLHLHLVTLSITHRFRMPGWQTFQNTTSFDGLALPLWPCLLWPTTSTLLYWQVRSARPSPAMLLPTCILFVQSRLLPTGSAPWGSTVLACCMNTPPKADRKADVAIVNIEHKTIHTRSQLRKQYRLYRSPGPSDCPPNSVISGHIRAAEKDHVAVLSLARALWSSR